MKIPFSVTLLVFSDTWISTSVTDIMNLLVRLYETKMNVFFFCNAVVTARKRSLEKVMFLHLSVNQSVHGRRVWSLGDVVLMGGVVLRRVILEGCVLPRTRKAGGTHAIGMLSCYEYDHL